MKRLLMMCAVSALLFAGSDMKKVSYALGSQMATNFNAQGVELDVEAFVQGLKDGFNDASTMTPEEMNQVIMAFQTEFREIQEAKRKEKAESNKGEATAYLEKNKARAEVKTTDSGLQYEVLASGDGKSPSATDRVSVHYTGKLIDGTVFDSSVERGTPAEFPVNGVIKGWTEALQLMKVGDKWRLFVPPDLGYGERGAGAKILPNSMLIFDVELLEIK